MQTVVETPTYRKAAQAFFSEADRDEIVRMIAAYPEAGDLMPGTGGVSQAPPRTSRHGKTWWRACHLFVWR